MSIFVLKHISCGKKFVYLEPIRPKSSLLYPPLPSSLSQGKYISSVDHYSGKVYEKGKSSIFSCFMCILLFRFVALSPAPCRPHNIKPIRRGLKPRFHCRANPSCSSLLSTFERHVQLAGWVKGTRTDFLLARAARPSCTMDLHDRGNNVSYDAPNRCTNLYLPLSLCILSYRVYDCQGVPFLVDFFVFLQTTV
jgi:hypothetical protein